MAVLKTDGLVGLWSGICGPSGFGVIHEAADYFAPGIMTICLAHYRPQLARRVEQAIPAIKELDEITTDNYAEKFALANEKFGTEITLPENTNPLWPEEADAMAEATAKAEGK